MKDRFATHQLAGSAVANVWAVGFLDPHVWLQHIMNEMRVRTNEFYSLSMKNKCSLCDELLI
jgi:hypothetical protein